MGKALRSRMHVDGQWVSGKEHMEVKNPFNGAVEFEMPVASDEDMEKVFRSAHSLRSEAQAVSAKERGMWLDNVSVLLDDAAEEFADLIVREVGKPKKHALLEVARAVETFRFAAEAAKNIHGETIPFDAAANGEGRHGYFMRVPVGVVLAITPYNFPLNLVAHKIAPAIAGGNVVVLKPATRGSQTACRLLEVIIQAGVPPKLVSLLSGPGELIGKKLVEDRRFEMISFTGSTAVGEKILSMAGIKKVALEMGGNGAVVIEPDCDLKKAASDCVQASFSFSGQLCTSLQRIFVHKDAFEAFMKHFKSESEKLMIGDPLSPETDIGPMITTDAAEKVSKIIEAAVSKGAELVMGGRRQGAMFEPTVLTSTENGMDARDEEVFGPLVCIEPHGSFEQAIELVNRSRYGLQAGVYTNDLRKAHTFIRYVRAGGINVNDTTTFRVDNMPFGGIKKSGLGREGVKYAIEEMTYLKTVCFNLN